MRNLRPESRKDEALKVLFAFHHPGALRYFEAVVRHLCSMDHRVTVVYGDKKDPLYKQAPIALDSALNACQAELENFSCEPMLGRKGWLLLANARELLNYANYLRPEHPTPGQAKRAKPAVRRPLSKALKRSAVNRLLASEKARKILRQIEPLIPPDQAVTRFLRAERPEIVVASPFIFILSQELEYVKAARALGIPTVVAVLSWDNLTSKGTFHIVPDWTFVWNASLAREATVLHDIPEEKIFVTGAPVFDFWFEMKPSLDRSTFCTKIRIDPNRPFVLYLCSSQFIAGNETLFVRELAGVLAEHPRARGVSLVVRPHPLNALIWKGFEATNVTIWPEKVEWVDVPGAKQEYYDTIFHSAAVLGVNTSAFLEAAILSKPCLTVVDEHYRAKQTGLGHFMHLLDGDFLEIASSIPEAVSLVGEILNGSDAKREQRGRFVREFIRPWGMDRSASKIMAAAIEAVARHKSPVDWAAAGGEDRA
jgi:hypothetical protein